MATWLALSGQFRKIRSIEVDSGQFTSGVFRDGLNPDNNMLRNEQYGGINGRQMQDPIRILAELIEDANVTKKELHIFSADLSKAFDTLEYWSQAMSWRALGHQRRW